MAVVVGVGDAVGGNVMVKDTTLVPSLLQLLLGSFSISMIDPGG